MISERPRLGRSAVPPSALLYSGPLPGTGIVHLGLGNFHRAHLAVYTAKAVAAQGGDWGICGYSARSQRVAAAMVEQDLLYSVVDIAPESDRVVVPAIHTSALGGQTDSSLILAQIAQASTAIVSMTVTEAGYTVSQRTNSLDLDLPAIQADVAGSASPSTPIGLISRALQRRARTHGAPITVLSCDNMAENGSRSQALVREFAQALPRNERDELLAFVDKSVTFPNSMVDRIVPSTEARHQHLAAERLGVLDLVPVPAEPFTMWVIEDDFAAGRPRWEAGGAVFTDEVANYELMKLRLLNGTHSLLAYLGALDGRQTIPEARFEGFIESAARHLINEDYRPTLTIPSGVDVEAYVERLFSRWSNTVLADRTSRVGSDGSVKLPQRMTDPTRYHAARGHVPQHICLTVAAFLACLAPMDGYDPGPIAATMVDPAKQLLAGLSATVSSPRELVRAVFDKADLFSTQLSDLPEFVDRIGDYLEILVAHGVRAAAAEAEASSQLRSDNGHDPCRNSSRRLPN